MERRSWDRWRLVAILAALSGLVSVLVIPTTATALSNYIGLRADGSVASSPDAAAARSDDFMYVVVRGTDNAIYMTSFLPFISEWGPWEPLGAPPGGAVGDPALVSWAPGRLDLFVRGTDNKLWQKFRPVAGSWSNWIKPVGDEGVLDSSPEVSTRGTARLDVFVIGTDRQVYQRVYADGWNTEWLPQGEPAGPVGLVGEPASASRDADTVDLFARGTDDKLWGKSWNGTAWSAWAQPVGNDGTLASSPEAVSGGPSQLVVFAKGTDQNLYSNEAFGGVWRGWVRETLTGNNPFQDSPTAIARNTNRIDVFVRGLDNKAYRYVYQP